MDEIREIALRIKELREICDYTEEEIAAQLGISVELYKQYEANGQDIPINVIYQLAKLYKVDFSELVTGVSAKLKTYQVVRGGNGQKADR